MLTTKIIIAVILVVIAIIVLAGKGDWLIAGYNTASEEEKAKVNVKRLRIVIGTLLLAIAPLLFLLGDQSDKVTALIVAGIIMVLTAVALIIANTWAMKK